MCTGWTNKKCTDWPKLSQTVHTLNRLAKKNITNCIVTIYITLYYITLTTLITLHFEAFLRFLHIHIFSWLYNLAPCQAFWSSKRPELLAITFHSLLGHLENIKSRIQIIYDECNLYFPYALIHIMKVMQSQSQINYMGQNIVFPFNQLGIFNRKNLLI